MTDELFEIIDDATGAVIGTAPRKRCHGDPSLIHRSVHVVVYSTDGKSILLQKRKMTKDIQPGKWDTAVGGHLMVGETYEQAAAREMGEELGIHEKDQLRFLFDFKVRNEIESENIRVFSIAYDGPFFPQESELDGVEFFTITDLKQRLNSGNTDDFTPLLCRELAMLPEIEH
ncbi:MAG: NUDIX domain-containing protein [Lentisphaeria bacterium]|nr:NUDIX domain-containing protein [Lentisphaeria bacterium]